MAQTLRPLDRGWMPGVPGLLFAVTFVAVAIEASGRGDTVSVGLALAMVAFLGWGSTFVMRRSFALNRATRERNRRAQQYPDEPWRWLPEWDGSRAIHADRHFGPTVLELREVPVRLGGELHATLHTSLRELPPDKFDVRLAAEVRSSRPGHRGRVSVTTEVVWKSHRQVKGVLDAERGVTIDVDRQIPNHLPEFNDSAPSTDVCWSLTVTTRIKGRPFHARFRLPVFTA
jgi:hypothetical protein